MSADDWSAGAAYVDGKFCPIGEAAVPLLDWGFVKSDATYDVVGVWQDRFFRLDDHLDRFEQSIAALSMTLPLERRELNSILAECVQRAGLADAYVSLTLTRGVPPAGSRDPRGFRNRFYAFAVPYIHIHDAKRAGRGARLAIVDRMRIPPGSIDPRVKNYHWLDLILGQIETLDAGSELPVLTDGAGNLTEGAGFNIFAVFDGSIATPATGVLEGITRRTTMEICRQLDLPVATRALLATQLARADEIFVTSTAGGIMPVGWLDGRKLAIEAPGPVTKQIHETYWNWHTDPAWTTQVADCLAD